jgi:hypothetical protein
MKAYSYKAALFCEACGLKIKKSLDTAGLKPVNVDDETTFDSDQYPKGPTEVGESDTYQHCDKCGLFFANTLTPEGVDYHVAAVAIYLKTGHGRVKILDQWVEDLREYSLEDSQKTTIDRYLDKRSKTK